MYDYLAHNVNDSVDKLKDVRFLFKTLFIENVHNKTLPEWTKRVYPEKMRYPKDLGFTLQTWTHELKRLRAGPLISNIVETYQSLSSKLFTDDNDHDWDAKHRFHWERKMNMYSAHDSTLSNFLNSLGMFDPPIRPPYASCIMIELLKNVKSDGHFIRFYYHNETDVTFGNGTTKPHLLHMPGCDSTCPLEKFDELTKPLRPLDWERECRSKNI